MIPTYTRGITPVLCTDGFKTDMALMCMALFTGVAQVCAFAASQSVAAIGWFNNAHFVLAPLCIVAAIVVLVFVKDDAAVMKIREQEEAEDRAEAKEEK